MRTLLAAAALLSLAGCGAIGPPLPPALHIPERITGVSVVQKGAELEVGFVVTGRTTDELLVRSLDGINVRFGEVGGTPEAWAKRARTIAVNAPKIGPTSLRVPAAGLENRDVAVTVSATGPTGRASKWSEPVIVHVVAAPRVPELEAMPGPGGVLLRWRTAPAAEAGTHWRVWRQRKTDAKALNVAEVGDATEWFDSAAQEEDVLYTFQVQAIVAAGTKTAEGELSPPVSLVYKDVFPPEVPANVTAIAGVGTIELAWEPDREPDLKGYQIWRAEGGGALAKLGGLITESTYSDKALVSGKLYRYAVSAADQKGNTSKLSAAVEVTAP
jgi:predicted small lipoprotein YifL